MQSAFVFNHIRSDLCYSERCQFVCARVCVWFTGTWTGVWMSLFFFSVFFSSSSASRACALCFQEYATVKLKVVKLLKSPWLQFHSYVLFLTWEEEEDARARKNAPFSPSARNPRGSRSCPRCWKHSEIKTWGKKSHTTSNNMFTSTTVRVRD